MSEAETSNGSAGTSARMLDVAERLLQVHGYNGFSYGDIAAELGITRAALHYHFKSKAELGEALIDRYTDRFAAALSELDRSRPDAPAKLAGYVDLYAAVVRRHRMCLCGMLAAEYQTLPAGMQTRVSRFFERNIGWLEGVLEQGRSEGSLMVTGPVQEVAAMLLSGLEGALLVSRVGDAGPRFSAAAAQLLDALTPAALPRR